MSNDNSEAWKAADYIMAMVAKGARVTAEEKTMAHHILAADLPREGNCYGFFNAPASAERTQQVHAPCGCPESTGGSFGSPGPVCIGQNNPGCRKRAELALLLAPASSERATKEVVAAWLRERDCTYAAALVERYWDITDHG